MAVAEVEAADINFPEWSEYRNKNGLDLLGMQNSSSVSTREISISGLYQ